ERFIPDPFSAKEGARIYRTGDLTRFRNDGAIEFLGRIDHQVKLRGFRIELGEIEASLDAIADVEQSLVMLREDVPGEKRLVAYLTGGGSQAPDIPALRDSLKARLPEYMVPAAFVALDEFPLLPNGKIDRNGLPEPSGSRDVGNEYVPPASVNETVLAGIWSDLLRIDRVGIHDNFFELGGDSILSIQIITRAAKSGLHLTPKQVFQHQSIAELAVAVGTARQIEAEQGPVSGSAELTPVQNWFFAQPEIDLHHFNQSIRLNLGKHLDPEILEQALQAIVAHHDALRLTFRRTGARWKQEFSASEPSSVLRVIDVASFSADDRSQHILDAANKLQASLQLDSGCLLAAALFESGADRPQELIIVVHHLAMDGLSWRILLEDLEHACLTLLDEQPVELPPKSSSFKVWSERLQEYAASAELAGETNRWREQFAVEDAAVPVDRAQGENTVASARSIVVSLDSSTTEQLLQDVPKAYRTQINDVLLTALGRAWRKWSDSEHLVLDLEGHGREEKFADADVSRTIGWFTTIYPVHINCSSDEPAGDALKRIKEQLHGIPDRGLGFGVLKYLANSGLQDITAPQVLFNYLGQFDQTFDASGFFDLADGPRGYEQSPQRLRSHLLDVNGGVYGGRLQVSFSYSENVHSEASIKSLGDNFRAELEALISHCVSGQNLGYTPSDFPLARLDQATTDELAHTYTDIEDIYPITPMQHGMLFHSIFAEESADYLSQVYLTQVVWELEGNLNAGAFESAWQAVTRRHASLRTSFHQSGLQDPLAIVHQGASILIHSEDWSEFDEEEQTQQLEKLLADDREQSFDLAKAPLMRLYLRRYSKNNFRFVWSHHHIIMDGWSIPVVLDELFQAYEAAIRNTTPQLGAVHSYRDYIAWLGGQDRAAAETHWRASLGEFTAPTPLPGAGKAYRGLQDKSSFAKCFVSFTPEETSALREVAKQQRLTVNTLAQGIWALVLSRYTGESDVLFGATTSGRPADLENVEAMVGLFLNTLPVRARIDAQSDMRSWMAAIQDDQLAARQHEYASLTDIQGWSDVPRGTPLFHTLLIFENYPDVSSLWEDRNSIRVRDMRALGWTSFPLTASVSVGDQFLLRLAYDTEYFNTRTAENIGAEFSRMLRKVIEDPEVLIRDLLVDEAEAGLLREQPAPTNEFERFPDSALEHSLVARFEAQVELRPDAPAVATRNHRWSYGDLNQRANAVAHALIEASVPAGERIGLILGHDAPMLAGLLGALKASQAYVPLDPHAPAARLRTIIRDAGLSALVAAPNHAGLAVELSAGTLPVISIAGTGDNSLPNPAISVEPDELAYILFTSGSTGTPKGVMQTHRNVLHHIRTYTNALHLAADDRLSLFSPYGFDAAVMDIYGALLNGACLSPIDIRDEESAADILRQLPELDITIFHSTPTVYRYLFEQQGETDLGAIRLVVLGGEEARPADLETFQKSFRGDALFINGLGPTESTLALQFFADHNTEIAGSVIPVGMAVAGTEVLLLDENGKPAGSSGEICIRGDYVTPGYWNAPQLTADAFIQNAQGRNSIYRTGDLGRYAPDGQLIFIGRRDAQIKVRGHRVEPGDIEAALTQHPDIDHSVVILREDEPGKSYLTGYCVPAPGREPDTAILRDYLLHLLPDYMIPAAFVTISEIPLTPNGKLDRNALPVPLWEADEDTYVAPTTETEQQVAAIWSDVLNVEQVGMHDDFFALGGHSLIATQLMARVRDAVGQELSLRTLFTDPTVAGLCAAIDNMHDTTDTHAIQPYPRDRDIPMSLMQQRLWFLDRFEGDSTAYNMFAAVRMRGSLNVTALQSAVDDLVARHESLRTHFIEQDGKALQIIIAEPGSQVVLGELTDSSDANITRVVTELARRPFDLEQGPLFETHLLEIARDDHVLVIRLHHIIGDNRSMQIIYRDLLTLYSMHCGLDAQPLPILPVQYADYAIWQSEMLESEESARQVDYWRTRLTNAPAVIDIPTDRPRPLMQSYSGTAASRMLSGELNNALQALGTQHRATLFMVLQAAFSVLLARYSGQDDIIVGTPVAGRKSSELENLIGFFLNTVVLRTDLSADPDFQTLLQQVRDNTLEGYDHQDIPFEKLVEELQPARDTSHSPIFQVMFTVLTPPPSPGDFPDLELEAVNAEFQTAKFDLFMALTSYDKGLGIHLEYNTDLFDRPTIERMLDHFETLLAGIVAAPDIPVSQLALLDATERQ
ncbi:MAG TPA: amino acid adenylation domain-containing protein, partial [Gammaproteobacteria bacterium]|nr:amino acid adenylation domain-containing protein [Gammaproteobacteria bacterium]